jgi:hypothetical protein
MVSGIRSRLAAVVAVLGMLAAPAAASAATGAATAPAASTGSVAGVSSLDWVTCPTAKKCVAVGADSNLNGKSVIVTAATGAAKAWPGDLAGEDPNAVACPGTTTCLTVADDAVATVAVSTGAMKVTAKPKPPAGNIVAMGRIACPSASTCYAVGFEGTSVSNTKATVFELSAAGKVLAKRTSTGTGIGTIACPSSTLCLISDNLPTGLAIQQLNNGRFGTSHKVPANTYIQAIACFQATLCYALGGSTSGSVTDELFPLNPATGAPGSAITLSNFDATGLTCISASECRIVGFVTPAYTPAVLNVTNGQPGTPAGEPGSSLSSIACATPTLCYAVGQDSSGAIVDKV